MKEITTVVIKIYKPGFILSNVIKHVASLNIDAFRNIDMVKLWKSASWSSVISNGFVAKYFHSLVGHAYKCYWGDMWWKRGYYVAGKHYLNYTDWQHAVNQYNFDIELHKIMGTYEGN